MFFQGNAGESLLEKMDLGNNAPKLIVSPYYSLGNKDLYEKIQNATYYVSNKIHSKIYFIEKECENILWLGSANCTRNGLLNNYECMVKVTTSLQREALEAWLEKYGAEVQNVEDEPAEVEESEEAKFESFVRTCKTELRVRKDNNRYIQTISFGKAPQGTDINVSIGLPGINKFEKYTGNDISFSVNKKELSGYLIFCLTRQDGKNIYRMVKATDIDEDYKKILQETINNIKNSRIENFLPSLPFYDDEDEDEECVSIENENCKNMIPTFSTKDGLYEKIVKMYALGDAGEKMIHKIRHQIEGNKDLFGDSADNFMAWTSWLNEGRN